MARKQGRRANGEGSVYQRGDGRWVAAVSFTDSDGRARQRTVYAKTQKEAIARKQELIKERDGGKLLAPAKETVGDFLAQWLTDVVPVKRRPATVHVYRSMVTHHLIPALGHIRIDRLRPEHVERMQRQALQAGLTPRTVQLMRSTLAAALNVAVARGRVARNIVELVDGPRIEPYAATVLTATAAKRLMQEAADDRFEAGYHLALYLGLRMGEVLGLRWQDIDWQRKQIQIRVQLAAVGPPPVFAEPKTRGSRRTLPLIPRLEVLLKQRHLQQLEDQMKTGTAWQDFDLVFTRPNGLPMHEATCRHIFHRLLRAAELPPMRFHDLRHACATLLAAEGVSARLSMAILGHASLAVNQLVYTHVMDGDMSDAVATLAQAITDADPELVTTSVTVNSRETA